MTGLVVVAALLLAAGAAAGEPDAGLHVERVDASAHPTVEVVVSAPHLDGTVAADRFRVFEGDDPLPVEAALVPPAAVEVALLVDTSGADATLSAVKSTAMDVMLRLPTHTRVSVVAAGNPPVVVAGVGTSLQDRMVAVAGLAGGGPPWLDDALDLAVRQFSGSARTVRAVVLVGGWQRDGEALSGTHRDRLAGQHVTLHAVRAGEGAAASGVAAVLARLTNVYRLRFEPRGEDDAVEVHLVAGDEPTATTVALPAQPAAGERTEAPSVARVGDGEQEASRWPALLFAGVAAAAALLLSAGVVLPARAAERRGAPAVEESWQAAAERVARETGAAEAVHETADRVARERREVAAELRAAGLEARSGAAVLAALPLVAFGVVLLVGRGGFDGVLAGVWRPAALLAALVLTAAGAAWLRRFARPPFSASPARWRGHERAAAAWQELAGTLDLARLYAAGGLALDESLARAGAGEPGHPARRLVEGDDAEAAPATDILAAASARVRAEQLAVAREQREAVPVAVAVPFLACTLPATILLVAVAWPSLGG